MAPFNKRGPKTSYNKPKHWSDIVEDDQGNSSSRILFIGDVPLGTRGNTIREVFTKFGEIQTSTPPSFGECVHGYAFLTFKDVDCAKRALWSCHLVDLFGHGRVSRVRFSKKYPHMKTDARADDASRLTEARTEWFQSPTVAGIANCSSGWDQSKNQSPTADSEFATLPPSAPKKMLAYAAKSANSPPPPRSMRVDVSPPPLRRTDCYRPNSSTCSEFRQEYDSSCDVVEERSGRDREVDSHVSDRRLVGRSYRPGYEAQNNEPSASHAGTVTQAPASLKQEATKKDSSDASPGPASSQDQKASNNSPRGEAYLPTQSFDTEAARHATQSETHSERVVPEMTRELERTSSAPAPSATTLDTASTLRYLESAPRGQPSVDERQAHSFPPFSSHSTQTDISPISTTFDVRINTPLSLPTDSINHLENDFDSSTSTAVQRLRVPIDDTSSITSSSTKSSTRKRQCANCKAPEGLLLGSLTKCDTCSRRYHGNCGNPSPESSTGSTSFKCGVCLRKARKLDCSTPQLRAPSPDLGTADKNSITDMSRRPSCEMAEGPSRLFSTTAPEDQIESTGIFDSTSLERSERRESDAAIEARRSQVDAVDPTEESKHQSKSLSSQLTLTDLNPAVKTISDDPSSSIETIDALQVSVEASTGDLSAAMLPSSPAKFDGPSEQPLEEAAIKNLVGIEMDPGELDPSTQGPARKSVSETTAMTLTDIKRQAAAMAARYKGLTCPPWRRSGRCQFGSRCMFAHHDTGIDPPLKSRINQNFTCYYWQNRLPCQHNYPCPHAHRDTGLYVGVDMKASTKHITCSFWQRYRCEWTADACKYAHQDTGVYATGTHGHDRSVASAIHSNEELEHGRGFASSTSSWPRTVTLTSQPISTSALSTPNLPSLDRAPKEPNEASYSSIPELTEEAKVKALSAGAGRQISSIAGSWNPASTTGSSRLSPKSTNEDRAVMVHGVDTPFSPASSINETVDDVIHGVDTPFSPSSSVNTAERLPLSARNTLSTAPSSPTRPGLESSPKPDTRRSSLLEHSRVASANGQVENEYTPVLQAQQLKQRPLGLDLDRSAFSQPTEKIEQVSDNSRSSTPVLRDEKVVSTPVKHYAKRSAIDPRLLRLSALASATAKSAPCTDHPEPKTSATKKCEKCTKRIMASASLCTSCSKDLAWYNVSNPPDFQKSEHEKPTVIGTRQVKPSVQESEHVGVLLSNFMRNNAAKSVLGASKKHGSVSAPVAEPTKALKRSNTDTLFISKKRPKIQTSTKIIKRPLGHRHESDTQVAALQGPVDSSSKSAETQKRDDLARLELLKKQNMEASSRQIQLVDFASPVERVKVNEDRCASVAASPQTAELPSLKHGEASHEGQVKHTTGQDQETATPRSESREAVDPQISLQAPTDDAQHSRSRDSFVNHEGLKQKRTIPSSNKLGRNQRRCENCTGSHKRCLHYRSGELDPALCYAFLQERKSFPKQQGSFSHEAQLAKIKASARLYIPARSDDDMSDVEHLENDDENGHLDNDEANDDDEEGADDNKEDDVDDEEEVEPARSRSSDELLGRFVESSKQFLRSPNMFNKAHVYKSSAGQGTQETPIVHASIPTPAQTPSPVWPEPETPTRKLSAERERHRGAAARPSSAQANAIAILRQRGVQFDSDTDSDEDMEERAPRTIVSSRMLGLNSKETSYDLFEVAPLLRPSVDPATIMRKPANIVPDFRAGIPKKQLWKNLLQIQCAERRSKSGNPHKIVERDLPSCIVSTTVQQQGPIPEIEKAKGTMSLFVPHTEMKKVDMPFEQFLRMPKEPVVVREKEVRKKEKVIEFELAYREGKNDRAQAVTLAGRKVRASGERWPFARG